jgi:hypothetical protein
VSVSHFALYRKKIESKLAHPYVRVVLLVYTVFAASCIRFTKKIRGLYFDGSGGGVGGGAVNNPIRRL